MGAAVGMAGVVGGPTVAVTEPTAMAIGGGVGWMAGMVSCMSSSGSGGSGEPSTGSAGEEKLTAQLKKLSPAEIRKLETEGGAHQLRVKPWERIKGYRNTIVTRTQAAISTLPRKAASVKQYRPGLTSITSEHKNDRYFRI